VQHRAAQRELVAGSVAIIDFVVVVVIIITTTAIRFVVINNIFDTSRVIHERCFPLPPSFSTAIPFFLTTPRQLRPEGQHGPPPRCAQ
jgi:hypothetical protein